MCSQHCLPCCLFLSRNSPMRYSCRRFSPFFFFFLLLLSLCLHSSTKEVCPFIGSLSNTTQNKQRKRGKEDRLDYYFFQGSSWPAMRKHSLCTCKILSSRSLKDILQKTKQNKSFAPNLFWLSLFLLHNKYKIPSMIRR